MESKTILLTREECINRVKNIDKKDVVKTCANVTIDVTTTALDVCANILKIVCASVAATGCIVVGIAFGQQINYYVSNGADVHYYVREIGEVTSYTLGLLATSGIVLTFKNKKIEKENSK